LPMVYIANVQTKISTNAMRASTSIQTLSMYAFAFFPEGRETVIVVLLNGVSLNIFEAFRFVAMQMNI